jgi:predicted DNA-binding transcriptional regulator AlpA
MPTLADTLPAADPWLAKKDVARLFGCTTQTVTNWVRAGRFPPPDTLPNGRPGWRQSAISAAVASQSADAA